MQIRFFDKTPDAVERLKRLGFEVLENKQSNVLAGRIAVEKLADLAEIAEDKIGCGKGTIKYAN